MAREPDENGGHIYHGTRHLIHFTELGRNRAGEAVVLEHLVWKGEGGVTRVSLSYHANAEREWLTPWLTRWPISRRPLTNCGHTM